MNAVALSPEAIARASGSSFLVSFSALAGDRRRALTAIYAFCRVADDAVDEAASTDEGRVQLAFWREELEAAVSGTARTPVGQRLAAAMRDYGVEARHLRAVLDGVQMDLDGVRYRTLDDLLVYCDRVASAVGLACLPVFGVQGAHAERYAIALGRALQLTNILRDLRADAEHGRCYVPQEWLECCAFEASWLGRPPAMQTLAQPLANLVARFAEAASGSFAAAAAELQHIGDRRALLAPETMAAVYRRLLDLLVHGARRDAGGFPSRKRVRVPRWQKLWLAWQTRRRLR